MKKVAIAIITHKNLLNEYEQLSLQSLLRVYSIKFDIYVVIPESLDGKIYREQGIKEIKLPDIWFSTYRKYNELCLQTMLYTFFINYEYLLLYQLDGFAFYDKLEYFCDLNYDYIGAPWEYGNFWYKNQDETIWYVGCGGVSLRKVETFLTITQLDEVIEQSSYEPEDMVISSLYEKIQIAPIKVAKKFCVTEYYDSLENSIPMFLHWYDHMDSKFYRDAIRKAGYDLPEKISYLIDWDCMKMQKYIKYWLNEFKVEAVKNALETLAGKVVDKCYIWGTGSNAVLITKMFRELGINIIAYIDNDIKKRAMPFMGKKVLSYLEVMHLDIFLFISPSDSDSIVRQLEDEKLKKNINYLIWKDFVLESGLCKGGLS